VEEALKIWMLLLPAVLAGSFVGAGVLAAFDDDWGAVTVFAILAVIAGVVALRFKKRFDTA
jgi:uncharacterized membrane protein YfcA